jgi:hypothetical protein
MEFIELIEKIKSLQPENDKLREEIRNLPKTQNVLFRLRT